MPPSAGVWDLDNEEDRNSFHLRFHWSIKDGVIFPSSCTLLLDVTAEMRCFLRKGLIFGNALNQLPNHIPFSTLFEGSNPLCQDSFQTVFALNVSFILINTKTKLVSKIAEFLCFVEHRLADGTCLLKRYCLKSISVNSVFSDNGSTPVPTTWSTDTCQAAAQMFYFCFLWWNCKRIWGF